MALPAILLLGTVLRVFKLGRESLWLDEVGTVNIAQKSISEMFHYIVHFDVHPPLYYFLLHLWIRLFGDSEFSVRFPSVIFGIATIWLIYVI